MSINVMFCNFDLVLGATCSRATRFLKFSQDDGSRNLLGICSPPRQTKALKTYDASLLGSKNRDHRSATTHPGAYFHDQVREEKPSSLQRFRRKLYEATVRDRKDFASRICDLEHDRPGYGRRTRPSH